MSTRQRSRPRANTYTDRLYKRRRQRTTPAWVTRLADRRLVAALVLAVEIGHLAAALVEWPDAPARGVVHVAAAALAGLLASAVYYGRKRIWLVLGVVVAVALAVLFVLY